MQSALKLGHIKNRIIRVHGEGRGEFGRIEAVPIYLALSFGGHRELCGQWPQRAKNRNAISSS